eukprot:g17823.t1
MVELRFISRHDAQQRWVYFASAFLNSGREDDEEDQIFEAIDDVLDVQVPVSSASSSLVVPDAEAERVRKLYEFMKREHDALGHTPSIELLYSGEALAALKDIRVNCKQCATFDDVSAIRRRGSLQQFSFGKNEKWAVDMVYTILGQIIKIIDLCTRLRVYELHDPTDLDGGRTGTAIRCWQRAKTVMGGAPADVFWDIGSEFISARFKRVVEASNTVWHEVGFEEAHRISKLEAGNGRDKKQMNKITTAPFPPFLELFVWNLAMHRVEEEAFDYDWQGFVDTVLREKNTSSDTHPEEHTLKSLIVQEMEFQINSIPILNTTVSPYNCHYGTFYRGVRDWEEKLLVEESKPTPIDGQINKFIDRNAKIQRCCRTIVFEKDVENLQRRREVVARCYARGKDARNFEIGQSVYVRRKGVGKFRKWISGVVEAINADDRTVTVSTGSRAQPYGHKDVALLAPLQGEDEVEYEFYPDSELLELVEDRGGVVVIDDETQQETGDADEQALAEQPVADLHTRRRDIFTSVRDGTSTMRRRAVGAGDDFQQCEKCGKSFTSLRRFLQHCAKCQGSITSNYRRGTRQSVNFDTSIPDLQLGVSASVRSTRPADFRPTSILSGTAAETANFALPFQYDNTENQPASDELDFPQGGAQGSSLRHLNSRLLELDVVENEDGEDHLDLSSDDDLGGAASSAAVPQMSERALRYKKREAKRAALDQHRVKPIVRKRARLLPTESEEEQEEQDRLQASKRAKSNPAKLLLTHSTPSLPESWRSSSTKQFKIPEEERLFTDGCLHPSVLKTLNSCKTGMEMVYENGSTYLTTPFDYPEGNADRAVDFSVLAKIESLVTAEKQQQQQYDYKLMKGPNEVVFLGSQLLNGRCIRKSLNQRDNRKDLQYVVVEASVCREKASRPAAGRSTFVRWGGGTSPRFEKAEDAQKYIKDSWVLTLYFEVCETAHEALEQFTKDVKSSSIVVTVEDGIAGGFLEYLCPAMAEEMRVIDKHKIFGREHKLADVKKRRKNLVTSRLLLVIKVDRITGEIVKVKGRWVTQGFRDLRFKRPDGAAAPPCRSYTICDTSITILLQYFQAAGSTGMIGDVSEAFLRGKRMIDMYDRPEDVEIYCQIPTCIQHLAVEGLPIFGECRELDKALYGQPDAPAAWEITLNETATSIGFAQSQVDPALWMYFLNAFEQGTAAQGERTIDKYYYDKVAELAKIDVGNLKARAQCLEAGAEHKTPRLRHWAQNTSLVNPNSIRLVDQLLPHSQREVPPTGAYGTHVDDILHGGDKFFHLRMFVLFSNFSLGSFSILEEGCRDVYIGRELTVVPFSFDQFLVKNHLDANKSHMEQTKIELPARALVVPTAGELQLVEERVGFPPNTKLTEYAETKKIPYCPLVVGEKRRMIQPIAYYMGQEVYASKIKPLHEPEVTEYFKAKARAAGDKWKLRNVRSPFKGRLGELIWLKYNALTAVSVSELASVAHSAESCSSYDEVDGFIEDLSGCIGVSKFPQSNILRIYYLAGLLQHHILGAADAGLERIGGTPFLAARDNPRINTISRFQPKPKRKFSSSTAIEVLAQKACSSEVIFLLQLLLGLSLCVVGRTFAQISDSRNCLQEPKEKNIRPDYHALSGLQREKLLRIYHGPGKFMWPDGLTKSFRDGQMWLLHLACNFGLIDQSMTHIVQTHIKDVLEIEENKQEMLITDWVRTLEDEDATEVKLQEQESEIPIINVLPPDVASVSSEPAGGAASSGSSSSPAAELQKPKVTAASTFITSGTEAAKLFVQRRRKLKLDYWEEDEKHLVRHHVKPRKNLMTPCDTDGVSGPCAHENLSHLRTTVCDYRNSAGQVIKTNRSDHWTDKRVEHGPLYKDFQPWVGRTVFYKKRASFGKRLSDNSVSTIPSGASAYQYGPELWSEQPRTGAGGDRCWGENGFASEFATAQLCSPAADQAALDSGAESYWKIHHSTCNWTRRLCTASIAKSTDPSPGASWPGCVQFWFYGYGMSMRILRAVCRYWCSTSFTKQH